MAANIAEFRVKVAGSDGKGGRLQDRALKLAGTTAGGPVDVAIVTAVEDYSKIKPLEAAVKLAGAGSTDFAVASLTGFVDGFSRVREVIVPYDATQVKQLPLPDGTWFLERIDTGLFLRLYYTAAVGQDVLVRYTKPHTVAAGSSTVYTTDDEAIADLATAYCCEALASLYAQSVDPSIGAETDRRTQSDLYRSEAQRWRHAYLAKMGLVPDERPRQGISNVYLERA